MKMCFLFQQQQHERVKLQTLQKHVKISKTHFKLAFQYFVCPPLASFKAFILLGMLSIVASVNHAETTTIEIRVTQLSNALT